VLVVHNVGSVSFSFRGIESPNVIDLSLRTQCKRFDWQLSFATQISSQLSVLSAVRVLSISTNSGVAAGQRDVDSTQWLELFQPFTHVTQVSISGKELGPGIARALVAEGMTTEVFPELTRLELSGDDGSSCVGRAVGQFITTRRLSGRAIEARY
jgi:hypothetical protein